MLLQAFILFIFSCCTITWDPLIATNVSLQTVLLFKKLDSFNRHYFLSGQTTDYYDTLKQKVLKSPLIRGFDMQNYSPHNPWFNWTGVDDGTVSKAIQWYKQTNQKGIITFHWHWFSPNGGELRTSTFYTNYTNFDVTKAVKQGTQQYNQTIRDIDAISIQLKKLQAQKIPILWRPLHEAGGRWFWWGAKGPEATKKLLDIIFDRINTYHQINNLIWVWSTPQQSWYPGKSRTDIIGYDSYPGSHNYNCNLKMFMQLRNIVNNTKMVALTQNGPIPDINECYKSGAMWSYFMSWSNLVDQQNSLEHLKEIYSNEKVKTIENV